ncbi:MAG: DUF1194 domain-containing protein [Proteobacteria bacterium]|nr:DUF1194 domain-containing protein [Pseudomonadota bacterium]
MMRRLLTLGKALIASLVLAAASGPASAATEAVDLALVLAVDVSRSIDEQEFQLQRQGYAAALTNPRVLQAIHSGPLRAIAVTYVEWSNDNEQRVIVDWAVIRDDEVAASVANAIVTAPRPFASRTSISAAIDFGMRAFERSGVEATRRVIDVSGDGTNNAGRAVTDARDAAVADGVTINGLVIINERPEGVFSRYHVAPPEGLPEYFRQNVIGGPGAFLLEVQGFASFAEAITKKLVNEISALPPPTKFAARDRSSR